MTGIRSTFLLIGLRKTKVQVPIPTPPRKLAFDDSDDDAGVEFASKNLGTARY